MSFLGDSFDGGVGNGDEYIWGEMGYKKSRDKRVENAAAAHFP